MRWTRKATRRASSAASTRGSSFSALPPPEDGLTRIASGASGSALPRSSPMLRRSLCPRRSRGRRDHRQRSAWNGPWQTAPAAESSLSARAPLVPSLGRTKQCATRITHTVTHSLAHSVQPQAPGFSGRSSFVMQLCVLHRHLSLRVDATTASLNLERGSLMVAANSRWTTGQLVTRSIGTLAMVLASLLLVASASAEVLALATSGGAYVTTGSGINPLKLTPYAVSGLGIDPTGKHVVFTPSEGEDDGSLMIYDIEGESTETLEPPQTKRKCTGGIRGTHQPENRSSAVHSRGSSRSILVAGISGSSLVANVAGR